MTQTQVVEEQRRPELNAEGKAALDAVLTKAAASRTVPAVHFAVTTADGPIYGNQAGERVFGEPDKGPVNEDTSERPTLTCANGQPCSCTRRRSS